MSSNSSVSRTEKPFRNLTAKELGIDSMLSDQPSSLTLESSEGDSSETVELHHSIEDDNPILQTVLHLRDDGYAGVILFGPPGTSKTFHAHEIAAKLVNDDGRRARFIQFHPSFQYEDFMEGYVPTKDGGFERKPKSFVELCNYASSIDPHDICVLVIDEFSRCDVARVFGEALTYLETSRRGQSFQLASGTRMIIPENLFVLATMNPWDKGVDELDAALERRFARVSLLPDPAALKAMLQSNGLALDIVEKVVSFFTYVSRHRNPMAHVGHAFFKNVKDPESLERLWKHQLVFHFERVFRLDPPSLTDIQKKWLDMFQQGVGATEPGEPAA